MQFTIHDGLDFGLPKQELYHLIKQAGFDGVLMWWSGEYNNKGYEKHPDMARSAGLFIENIHTPYFTANHLWRDNLAGSDQEKLMIKCIDDCAHNDIPTMIMHLTMGDVNFPNKTTGLSRVERIVSHAEQRQVKIAVENLRENDCLSAVFSRIKSPNIGFCFDAGHQNLRNRDIDLLSLYGDKLIALHLHDNDATGDKHMLPFDGSVDWVSTMAKIKQTEYKGPIALELKIDKTVLDITPERYLEEAYKRAIKLAKLASSP